MKTTKRNYCDEDQDCQRVVDATFAYIGKKFFLFSLIVVLLYFLALAVYNGVTQEAQPNKDELIKIK